MTDRGFHWFPGFRGSCLKRKGRSTRGANSCFLSPWRTLYAEDQPAMATRRVIETDSMGDIAVAADRYWGAQTERSLHHFSIGEEHFHAAADPRARHPEKGRRARQRRLGHCSPERGRPDRPRRRRGDRAARLDDHFPLFVWQTGSGTQTNMNANEVISNRAIELAGGELGQQEADPSERSRQSRPVVERHVSDGDAHRGGREIVRRLAAGGRPAARDARRQSRARSRTSSRSAARTCRTRRRSRSARRSPAGSRSSISPMRAIDAALPAVYELALGGTAVGTGLNAHSGICASGPRGRSPSSPALPFTSAPNKFAALAGHEALVALHGALKTLATALMKIANDVRWLASGPRSGLGELTDPGERARQLDHAGQGQSRRSPKR